MERCCLGQGPHLCAGIVQDGWNGLVRHDGSDLEDSDLNQTHSATLSISSDKKRERLAQRAIPNAQTAPELLMTTVVTTDMRKVCNLLVHRLEEGPVEVAHIDDGSSLWHVLHSLLGQANHAHNVNHEGLLQAIARDVPEVFYCVSLSTDTPPHTNPDTTDTQKFRTQGTRALQVE